MGGGGLLPMITDKSHNDITDCGVHKFSLVIAVQQYSVVIYWMCLI